MRIVKQGKTSVVIVMTHEKAQDVLKALSGHLKLGREADELRHQIQAIGVLSPNTSQWPLRYEYAPPLRPLSPAQTLKHPE